MKQENANQNVLTASLRFVPGWLLLLLALWPADSLAASAEEEIRFLIGSVGRDGCAFIRNSQRWSRRSARDHLRSKWQLNEHLVEDAEDFVEKIASQSATSGQPYLIRCRNQQEQSARDWFSQLLSEYRAANRP